MADTKTEVLRMRITPELKAAIAAAAEKDGRTMSNYLEWIIRKELSQK